MHAAALSFVGNPNYLSILFAFFEIHRAINKDVWAQRDPAEKPSKLRPIKLAHKLKTIRK
jgi:hypothetical protein